MRYTNVVEGKFIDRPNRFIAHVLVDGVTETVHVKNTGRCREILTPGTICYLEKSNNPARSTAYDLIAARKGSLLINIDSQAPNKVVLEWLKKGALFPNAVTIQPEKVYGNSRFDFYIEADVEGQSGAERIFMEVKGVTLEQDGYVSFPDAPSDRAVKHVEELIAAKQDGYRVMVMFVIQICGMKSFSPAAHIHPEFAAALKKAKAAGVEILAYDCNVEKDFLEVRRAVPVVIESNKRGQLEDITAPLLDWYGRDHRILPWREDPTPYKVWISEIMLQQTRVEAVKPYFERFIRTLPDVQHLATAEEEVLLKLWEGLGYYSRVRNLQKAAVQIMERFDGVIPSAYEELLMLTGIGNYTAGAISSIAYHKPNPAVDGNVLRVLSRVRGDERPISDVKVKAAVEAELRPIMPGEKSGDLNQALMELGACVCIPNGAPLCDKCPLADICVAHFEKRETELPQKEAKAKRTIEKKTILVLRDATYTAIRKRENKGLLAGMYEFPWLEGHKTAEEVTAYLAENGIRTIRIRELENGKHIFTHKEWHMKGYMVRVDELDQGIRSDAVSDWIYIEPEETKTQYPIPSAFRTYTRYLNMKLGKELFDE